MYQPHEIVMNDRQPVHVGPEHNRSRYHFEAHLQEVVIRRIIPTAAESLDEEEIL